MKKNMLSIIALMMSGVVCADVDTNDVFLRDLFLEKKEKAFSRQPWRPIQDQARNTVVQIFSHVAQIDLLQPYKTPLQKASRGSGFFINDEGDIITNAHVVNQALALWIQVPALGKELIDVDVVGICPERDIALLRISDEGRAALCNTLGSIPFLTLGDSNTVYRSDEVLALGYPLGQESLKSTNGIISGREKQFIQMSAAINPGSSGGPLLNSEGHVIGINSAGITEAQNVGYIIPINEVHVILDDLYRFPVLRKPYLGILSINSTPELAEYFGNPQPGGCHVIEVLENSPLDKAGIKTGDIIYSINGYVTDIFCQITVPWSEDKISVIDYISTLSVGDSVDIVLYRNGTRIEKNVLFDRWELPAVHSVYPGYDFLDYEIFGGMVVMELTLNHIYALRSVAPGLSHYNEMCNQSEPVLVISHIFANSHLGRTRTLAIGTTITEINKRSVRTLADFREALQHPITENVLGDTIDPLFTIKGSDNEGRVSHNLFVPLSHHKLLDENLILSQQFHYPISDAVKALYN